jgi:hypothetical protein
MFEIKPTFVVTPFLKLITTLLTFIILIKQLLTYSQSVKNLYHFISDFFNQVELLLKFI